MKIMGTGTYCFYDIRFDRFLHADRGLDGVIELLTWERHLNLPTLVTFQFVDINREINTEPYISYTHKFVAFADYHASNFNTVKQIVNIPTEFIMVVRLDLSGEVQANHLDAHEWKTFVMIFNKCSL